MSSLKFKKGDILEYIYEGFDREWKGSKYIFEEYFDGDRSVRTRSLEDYPHLDIRKNEVCNFKATRFKLLKRKVTKDYYPSWL